MNINTHAHSQKTFTQRSISQTLLNMLEHDYSRLLRVCYDRAPKHRLALTFILSALWHGVYPGYYFTFITAIPITMAARSVSTPPPPEIQMNTLAHNCKEMNSQQMGQSVFFPVVVLIALLNFQTPIVQQNRTHRNLVTLVV